MCWLRRPMRCGGSVRRCYIRGQRQRRNKIYNPDTKKNRRKRFSTGYHTPKNLSGIIVVKVVKAQVEHATLPRVAVCCYVSRCTGSVHWPVDVTNITTPLDHVLPHIKMRIPIRERKGDRLFPLSDKFTARDLFEDGRWAARACAAIDER